MSVTQLGALTTSAVDGLTGAQLGALSLIQAARQQRGRWGVEHARSSPHLVRPSLGRLRRTQLGGLSSTDVGSFTATELSAAALIADRGTHCHALAGLTSDQISDFDDDTAFGAAFAVAGYAIAGANQRIVGHAAFVPQPRHGDRLECFAIDQ